jgi:hypothetical protein
MSYVVVAISSHTEAAGDVSFGVEPSMVLGDFPTVEVARAEASRLTDSFGVHEDRVGPITQDAASLSFMVCEHREQADESLADMKALVIAANAEATARSDLQECHGPYAPDEASYLPPEEATARVETALVDAFDTVDDHLLAVRDELWQQIPAAVRGAIDTGGRIDYQQIARRLSADARARHLPERAAELKGRIRGLGPSEDDIAASPGEPAETPGR